MSTAHTAYISLQGVSHVFDAEAGGQVTAFRDIDIEIGRGQIVTLVGQSGCGKSTLLNIIAGLVSPSAGSLTFRSDDGAAVIPTIGYITQEDRLLPWRTVLDNAVLPLELRKVGKAERRRIATAVLQRVGLGDFLGKRPDQLSGGMRQRAAIARALTLKPEILLMDEPFGALDAWTRHSLHELLSEVKAEFNTTVVLVTHDVHEALALSDKVITLAPRPGRVLAEYLLPAMSLPRRISDLHTGPLHKTFTAIRSDLGLKD